MSRARSISWRRISVMFARMSGRSIFGFRIEPRSPPVQVTTWTSTPSATYFAVDAAPLLDSSSGWACTCISRSPARGVLPVRAQLAVRVYGSCRWRGWTSRRLTHAQVRDAQPTVSGPRRAVRRTARPSPAVRRAVVGAARARLLACWRVPGLARLDALVARRPRRSSSELVDASTSSTSTPRPPRSTSGSATTTPRRPACCGRIAEDHASSASCPSTPTRPRGGRTTSSGSSAPSAGPPPSTCRVHRRRPAPAPLIARSTCSSTAIWTVRLDTLDVLRRP